MQRGELQPRRRPEARHAGVQGQLERDLREEEEKALGRTRHRQHGFERAASGWKRKFDAKLVRHILI